MILFTFICNIFTLFKFIYSIKIKYTQFNLEIYEDKPIIKISSNNYSIKFNLTSIKINGIEKNIMTFDNKSLINKITLYNLRCYNYNITTIPSTNVTLNFYFFIDNGNINSFNNLVKISEGFLLINFTLDNIFNSTYEINMKIDNSNILKKVDNYTYEIQDGIIYLTNNENLSNFKNINEMNLKILGSLESNSYIGIQIKKGKLILILCDYIWIGLFLIIILLCCFFFIFKIFSLMSQKYSNQKLKDEKKESILKN